MPKFRLDSGSKFLGSARLGLGICRLGSAQARKFQARSTSNHKRLYSLSYTVDGILSVHVHNQRIRKFQARSKVLV